MLQNGEALLIDMDTLCVGHPIFEFGSMYNAYLGFGNLNHAQTKDFLGISYETAGQIWKKSLALYLGTDDETVLKKVEDQARIVGYTRLMRRLIRRHGLENDEDRKCIACYKNHILELLDEVDTLAF